MYKWIIHSLTLYACGVHSFTRPNMWCTSLYPSTETGVCSLGGHARERGTLTPPSPTNLTLTRLFCSTNLLTFGGQTQVFVPSAGTPASGGHHADILACLGPMPTEEEWAERGLDKYGLIAVCPPRIRAKRCKDFHLKAKASIWP